MSNLTSLQGINNAETTSALTATNQATADANDRQFFGLISGWINNLINSVLGNVIGQVQSAVESTTANVVNQGVAAAQQVANEIEEAVANSSQNIKEDLSALSEEINDDLKETMSEFREQMGGLAEDFVQTILGGLDEVFDKLDQMKKEAEREAKEKAKKEREEYLAYMNTARNETIISNEELTTSFAKDYVTILGEGNIVETLKDRDTVALAAGAHANVIDAGGGSDLLQLDGDRKDYIIDRISDTTFKVINIETGAVNWVSNFEQIQFEDTREMKIQEQDPTANAKKDKEKAKEKDKKS